MAGRIPRVFINDLLARTDIVDLVDARVKLKKQGKNYHACCPFHNEKTPSFTVNADKQFYHCFGCGAHGNAIDFLMNYDRLEFVESVEELATMAGLEIPYEAGNGPSQIERHQRQNLYQLMDGLSDFYQQALRQPSSQSAQQYLMQRGLSHKLLITLLSAMPLLVGITHSSVLAVILLAALRLMMRACWSIMIMAARTTVSATA